ncbi:MAG: hypothetical protein K0U39_07290 [Alphaproteobacteria bacterium]|nr:hypothetical protein [Alphaproteobacteria bacterium]
MSLTMCNQRLQIGTERRGDEVKTGSGRRSVLFSFDKLLQIAENGIVK